MSAETFDNSHLNLGHIQMIDPRDFIAEAKRNRDLYDSPHAGTMRAIAQTDMSRNAEMAADNRPIHEPDVAAEAKSNAARVGAHYAAGNVVLIGSQAKIDRLRVAIGAAGLAEWFTLAEPVTENLVVCGYHPTATA